MRDVTDSLEIKLVSALLEEILKGFTEQVHHHHVEHFTVLSLLVANEVKEWNKSLTTHLMDQFGLPEEHNVPLHFHSFFLLPNH